MARRNFGLNAADGGSRRFIMVQLPEATPERSKARADGFDTVADLGVERIRRVIAKLSNEQTGQQQLPTRPNDLGLRVFRLSRSSFKQWTEEAPSALGGYSEALEFFVDPLRPGWEVQDVLWEVALREGYALDARVSEVTTAGANRVFRVTDPESERSFLLCLDPELNPQTLDSLELSTDDVFICRDAALTDDLAVNLALQCRLKTI